MKLRLIISLLISINLLAFSAYAENEKEISTKQIKDIEVLKQESSVRCTLFVTDRHYHFFNDDVFDEEFFTPFVSCDDYLFLKNNPFLGTYFLMIFPASAWLDEESLHILEIL